MNRTVYGRTAWWRAPPGGWDLYLPRRVQLWRMVSPLPWAGLEGSDFLCCSGPSGDLRLDSRRMLLRAAVMHPAVCVSHFRGCVFWSLPPSEKQFSLIAYVMIQTKHGLLMSVVKC